MCASLLAIMLVVTLDYAVRRKWHLRVQAWWFQFRLNMINHSVCTTRDEITAYESRQRWQEAFAEGDYLRAILRERDVLIAKLRRIDAQLQVWR